MIINDLNTLVQALKDQNGDVRKNAASTLGSIGEGAVNAVPTLVQALKDQDQDVRRNAATALGSIGSPEALKAVKEYESRQ
jgi:HEAT repeat protein